MEKYPVSPNQKVNGLVWFARMLSKVRLNEAGQLPADYQKNLGFGYDGWCLRFIGIEYAALVQKVKEGGTDEEILEWCLTTGRRPTEIEIWTWNDCIRKRGWRDDWNGGTEKLARMKQEYGLGDRTDIQTFFDLYDADEEKGRTSR
jgi:hypothetical protein